MNEAEKQKYIVAAGEHFRELFAEQLERAERLKKRERVDFSKLDKIKIAIADGDGIGPVIMAAARRVLSALLSDLIADGKIELCDVGGLTIENRLKLGVSVPQDALDAIKSCHVLLKGPTATPKGTSMESANVTLRRELDLFANVRPVRIPSENIDWTFFRENTEGEYVLGSRGFDVPDTLAFDFKVTTDEGTRRIAKAAFDYAVANGKKSVSIVTKANIMKKTDAMFSEICHEVAKDYPTLELEDWYIDIMTANLVNKNIRSKFEVFVLPNLYGDIITDEAAEIGGGVGTAGSANIGDRYAMFEAIHGTAPRMVELGLAEYANPTSILRACELMLSHIGLSDRARILSSAIEKCAVVERKLTVTGDKDGAKCADFADYVIESLY